MFVFLSESILSWKEELVVYVVVKE